MRGTRKPTQQNKNTTYEAKEVELTDADAEEIEKARIALKTEIVISEQTLTKAQELYMDYIPPAVIKTFCDSPQAAIDVEHFAGVIVDARKNTQGVKPTVATLNSNTKKVKEKVKQLKNKMLQADKVKSKCTYKVPDAD